MRNIKKIQIDEMFVHILDNRKPELITSDFPFEFGSNQVLMDYFAGHISNSLSDATAKAAKFNNINADQASGICNAILSQKTTLAEGSKNLAQLLFEIIKKDLRISPADMAVCLYRDVDAPKVTYLAILKIDPSESFQHEVIREGRKTRIIYRESNETLTKEKLQKCAFIRSLDPRNPEFDMLLLDRQTGTVRDGIIALFFAERFLDAVDALDATKRTKLFYKTVMDTLNGIRETLKPEVSQDIDQRLATSVSGLSINVNTWLDQLPVEEPTREIFREAIQNKITDIEFETDTQIGGRLGAQVIYQGDHDLRLSIPVEFFSELVKPVSKIMTPDGEVNEVIIHTKKWIPVSR